ncbi:hypothetical protein [Parasphaerochaeta coccoides]|uniref:Outer membrane protein beta-barrel domain-containing protein n=1 Tax=Parasphaerochaeta coccoides (strain ATCC BAA-1237 / DSM 17374 / SPN1) TaxID=760011 RepID=F4GHG4_PARC1|nr:hypothetical protein [Parasphaerochaeta coccoides]AEC02553.1 hypothetical protein Spico_1347 [Parasphaerochaeta coccoides DSM 17374]
MKKNLIVVGLILLLLPTAAFASVFSFGPSVVYNVPVGEVDALGDIVEDFDVAKLSYGAEARVRLFFLQAGVVALVTPGSDADNFGFAGLLTAGVNFDLGLVGIGLGMGPRVNAKHAGNEWKITDHAGNNVTAENLEHVFKNAPMVYRANVDFNLGGITVGLTYTIDTKYKFAEPSKVENLAPDFKENAGRIGVSFLLNIL